MRTDWISKSLAGIVAGFTLALALAGLVAWGGPGGLSVPGKVQMVMWTITPLWLTAVSLVYLFPTGIHAWAWLGGANVLAWLALVVLRFMMA